MKVLYFLLLLTFFASCSSSSKISGRNKNKVALVKDGDGSSFEKAIFIHERSESSGIKAENIWLRQNYPGYKLQKQSLVQHEKRFYDVMSIITAEGQQKSIYFDINKFFGRTGKFNKLFRIHPQYSNGN